MADSIDINDAARWLLKVATADGSISNEEQAVIAEFANKYGVNLSEINIAEEEPLPEVDTEAEYKVVKVIMTKDESYRRQRERINNRLKSSRISGGTDYMQNKVIVKMPDNSFIQDYATVSTFTKVVEYIGYNRVFELGLKWGKYDIVTQTPFGTRYKEASRGWYVLSNWPTVVAAQYINKIADELNLYIEADVVPK